MYVVLLFTKIILGFTTKSKITKLSIVQKNLFIYLQKACFIFKESLCVKFTCFNIVILNDTLN